MYVVIADLSLSVATKPAPSLFVQFIIIRSDITE